MRPVSNFLIMQLSNSRDGGGDTQSDKTLRKDLKSGFDNWAGGLYNPIFDS